MMPSVPPAQEIALPVSARDPWPPARRLLVSLALVATVLVFTFIPLPNVAAFEVFERLGVRGFHGLGNLSIGALGITPIVSAFTSVELASLVVPRWRPLRQPP